MIQIALVGNPNCGKTTLFNALTGSNQYVGNWPGVTVEKKEGRVRNNKEILIQDLPGIYSLSPYTPEEIVTRNYLVKEQPDAIINIVDASNLERNLYLTSQVLELQIPMVIALNMIDVVEKRGDKIDINALSKRLQVPVVALSAMKGKGIEEVLKEAVSVALGHKEPHVQEFSRPVQEAVEKIAKLLPPSRFQNWYALKLFEEDEKIEEEFQLDQKSLEEIASIRESMEEEYDDDPQSIITDERYNWIAEILKGLYQRQDAHTLSLSDKIDQVVTNRFLAIPLFILAMGLVYWLALYAIGTPLTDWVDQVLIHDWIQGGMSSFLSSIHAPMAVQSLIVDGIIGGLGAPLSFLPQIAVVFLCLSFLEDCGYMSRIAFIMDRIFRRFGLSGKSFISFMVSTGCGVPGVLSTRTIEDVKDRRMTMIITTSMPCGAKLPLIAMIAGAVLGNTDSWWIAWVAYVFGIFAIIVSALVLKHMPMFAGKPAPFIMELPSYHLPKLSNVLKQTWERCWHFIQKAGTILFACCIVTWFLMSYGFGPDGFGMVSVQYSLMASIGSFLSVIFAPLGWGNWQAVASALSGFVAKEQIVVTMGQIANVTDETGELPELWMAVHTILPGIGASLSFLLFNLLDAPCLAAVSTIARELHSRIWTAFAIGWQMFYAYSISLIVFQLTNWFMTGSFGFWTIVAILILAWYIYMIFRPMPEPKPGKLTEAFS